MRRKRLETRNTERKTPPAEPLAEGIHGSHFTPREIDTIRRRRSELMAGGKKDQEISTILSHETGRTAATLREKIRKLVNVGEFPPNPHRQTDFTGAELDTIRRR